MENRFIIRWIIFFVIYVIVDYYYFQMMYTLFKQRWAYVVIEVISALLLGLFILKYIYFHGEQMMPLTWQNYVIGGLLSFTVFKLFTLIFLIPEDIYRVGYALYTKYFSSKPQTIWLSRRKFISQLAIGVAAVPFASLMYGVIFGRYNFRVIKHRLFFEDLPKDFDGYTLTQISDLHSGSFDNKKKVTYAIDLINDQKSDVILFTGDIVNNRSEELLPWKNIYARLEARDGKYSILGNHDYGDYERWESPLQKQENFDCLLQMQREMGFDLLLNEHRYLHRGSSKIALVGVENWGEGGFKKAGDLQIAKQGIAPEDFKILMSHDPTHWQYRVLNDDDHFHLTLSGHTHGMQFGIEIPGIIKWSPSQWRYKYWAGLYQQAGKYINVNRGLGYIGYPGRFGVWPEISVIELRRGTTPAKQI